ncbi:DNA-binding transcriptional regulator, LysR family [Melghirimyces thermohalophilus]|uniref:DNA-binding transcriptional regulator, LysR family n=1 Tax=Melghirimyces thermohalophilus TaxID=1236220 RepID=A0A1G6NVX0_9BACL|nr:LysR family transcriptional regulator [Melghirimyces thermohalophilus]SDC71494.1 DNA-binding transcriptional regulator, LysR family [Melghirimyces thermohalophilus]
MDLKQLRYFVTIAQEGQITRAANKLHMAQPPLSQSLKMLEQELGVPLLERNRRKMELTEAGRILYRKAQALLRQFDETIVEVKETGKGLRGMLSIGCVKSCFAYIPERVQFFRKEYPDVTFELREGDSFQLAEYLENRDIEIAVVRLPLDHKNFAYLPLPNEVYVAVLPAHWVKAPTQTHILMEDLAGLPLLLLHRISGVGQYEIIMNEFKKHGLKPHVVCECPDATMLLSLVSAGVGATLLPKSTLFTLPAQGVKVLEIGQTEITSEAAVVWLKDRYLSKSAIRFIETFQPS